MHRILQLESATSAILAGTDPIRSSHQGGRNEALKGWSTSPMTSRNLRMATHKGSGHTVKVGSNAVAEVTGFSFDETAETIETILFQFGTIHTFRIW